MADFEIAYGETEIHEGGYVHDPVDRGGETHRGVSRRFHPDWPGWKIVDQYKADFPDQFKQKINEDPRLVELSKALYREKYWIPIRGDDIPNQHVANKLFDTGVNQGVATSVGYLQDALNLLNRNQTDYADVNVDRKMGPATMKSLESFLKQERDQPDYLLKLMNIMQAAKYIEIMRRNPSQQRFARGWLNRVDLR